MLAEANRDARDAQKDHYRISAANSQAAKQVVESQALYSSQMVEYADRLADQKSDAAAEAEAVREAQEELQWEQELFHEKQLESMAHVEYYAWLQTTDGVAFDQWRLEAEPFAARVGESWSKWSSAWHNIPEKVSASQELENAKDQYEKEIVAIEKDMPTEPLVSKWVRVVERILYITPFAVGLLAFIYNLVMHRWRDGWGIVLDVFAVLFIHLGWAIIWLALAFGVCGPILLIYRLTLKAINRPKIKKMALEKNSAIESAKDNLLSAQNAHQSEIHRLKHLYGLGEGVVPALFTNETWRAYQRIGKVLENGADQRVRRDRLPSVPDKLTVVAEQDWWPSQIKQKYATEINGN